MRKVKAKAAPAKKKPARAKAAEKPARALKKQPAQAKVLRARSAKPAKAKVRSGGKAASAAAKRSAKKPVAKRTVKKPATMAKGARKPAAVAKRPVVKKSAAKPLKGAKKTATKVVAKKSIAKAKPAKKPVAKGVNKKLVAKGGSVRAAAKKPVAANRVVAKKPAKVAARKPIAKAAKPAAKKVAAKPVKPAAKVAKPVANAKVAVAKPTPVLPKAPAPKAVAPEAVRPQIAAPSAPKAAPPKPVPAEPKPVASEAAPKTPKSNPVRDAVAKLRAGRKTPRHELPRLDAPPAAPIMAPGHSETAVLIRRPQIETPSASARVLAEATARITARRARDMLPVSIATRRLILRAPIRGDVPELVKLADNRNIASKLARLPSPYTRADAIAFVEIFAQRADERAYAIILDGTFIGVVGFSFREGRPPELGYWLGEPHWGHGYMAEAVRGLIDAAHSTGLYGLIGARALADNEASIAILEKTGFKRVGKALTEEHGDEKRKIIVFELEAPRWA